MTSARYIVGDTRDVTATMPDGSVDLVLTSPPFLALRSYLPADHPDKHREIGSEATPAAFIDMLLELTAEWGRVLAPHGSIAVELGDTYSGKSGADDGTVEHAGRREHDPLGDHRSNGRREVRSDYGPAAAHSDTRWRGGEGWPLGKSKALIPELYRIALAYGINPLTGLPSPAGRWRVRNVITWCRPNPPVGALGDKYRPATSDLVIATRNSNRWFDLDAVRQPASPNTHARSATPRTDLPSQQRDGNWSTLAQIDSDPAAGAPPLDYWVIPPTGYTGSHYAVYPPELCRIPTLSMCPRHVCTQCGEPRRRIVDITRDNERDDSTRVKTGGPLARSQDRPPKVGWVMSHTTLGWTDCGHDSYRRGVVFDPFAGSGTTLLVATGNDRDAIGIDIDARNADLAVERLGMFITIEHHQKDAA